MSEVQHAEALSEKQLTARLKMALDISGIDTSYRSHALRGTGRYVSELVKYFDANRGAPIDVLKFNPNLLRGSKLLDRMVQVVPFGRQTVKRQILFPLSLSKRSLKRSGVEADIVHFPAHIDAPAWSRCRYIVTVLDLIPIVLADLYEPDHPGWRFRLARHLELQAIRNASLVLAISEHTARDVHRVLGIPYEQIVVTPLGVDRSFFEESHDPEGERSVRIQYRIPLERKVVLYVGGIDQRKNVAGLIKSFALVCEQEREAGREPPVLVIAGQVRNDRQFPRLEQLIREHGLNDDVILTGYVADNDLITLYKLSAVFFFPSIYEGFGLPPLEAMAAGTPVVSSDRSSIPEVLGKAAILINPENHFEAAGALSRVLHDVELASELREKGRRQAQKFTWDRTAELTLEAYLKLAGEQS